jgi:phosphoribulokinase
MSISHPIIAVTGSSGAGTTTTGNIFANIFREENINAVMAEGDSFHKYTRMEMSRLAESGSWGAKNHFSVEANHIDKLEALFQDYSATGAGQYRHYIHNEDYQLIARGLAPGTFTPWESLPEGTDLLFYEGLHGGLITERFNVPQYVDLLIGVSPIVNLEWMQKIHRDTIYRGYSQEAVVSTIINRMEDYVRYIVPQFANTHINFQRVPTVDTSNPFDAVEVPVENESMVVVRFRDPQEVDLPKLLQIIDGSFASRYDTIVVPGHKMSLAMDLIIRPKVAELMERRFKF